MGLLLSYLAHFRTERIQLFYSIIILILVSIGVFKIIRQAVEKRPKKRKDNFIDTLVNGQKPVKAISLATDPTKEGETLGKFILEIARGTRKKMKKVKVFFERFKGFILASGLAVLTIVEQCGGFINQLFAGKLSIGGVAILPIITLIASVVVGCISNGFTNEQWQKVKALFTKSTSNELVLAEIKKSLKENKAKLNQAHKDLDTHTLALENLETQLKNAQSTLEAKKQMLDMNLQLTTEEDVNNASQRVSSIRGGILIKKQEIENVEKDIDALNTTINALQSQL